MSIIVALRAKDCVWIGADGRVSKRYETITDDFQKWRKTSKGIWWAAAGHLRIYSLVEASPIDKVNTCRELCESLRKLVIEDNWTSDEESKGNSIDYNFDAIATDGREIVYYNGDGSFLRYGTVGDFAAQGCGRPYALGAISVMRRYVDYRMDDDVDCEEIIEAALQAACDSDQGCNGTFFIKKIER